ncbi:MAG: DUF4810 domain-containing protein [Propionivibrio sp.]
MRTLLTLLCVALLSGCVTTRQYQWGSYENDLYAAYKDPARSERLMEGLQSLISELEASKQKVPPGIYAELGTLYYQSGKLDDARALYEKERSAWPESQGLMAALIQSIERQRNKPQTAANVQEGGVK